MKKNNIRRILDTLCWNMEWHDKEDDMHDAILAIEALMLDERLDELRWLQKQYDNKPRDEWFKDPIPRRITKLERMKQDADMAINNTCEICHAYPMTTNCNNADCDK